MNFSYSWEFNWNNPNQKEISYGARTTIFSRFVQNTWVSCGWIFIYFFIYTKNSIGAFRIVVEAYDETTYEKKLFWVDYSEIFFENAVGIFWRQIYYEEVSA